MPYSGFVGRLKIGKKLKKTEKIGEKNEKKGKKKAKKVTFGDIDIAEVVLVKRRRILWLTEAR